MKILYWNVRGIANSPTKLAIKRLITQNKPDILVIAEPWIEFSNFPVRWLARQDLKLFATNNRNGQIPNLWCICKNQLNPNILSIDSQQVSFMLKEHDNYFSVSAIYASTSYLQRRNLWTNLQNLQTQYNVPWCFLGDYNAIIGAHEYQGAFQPSRTPMNEFLQWSNSNHLIHLPTRGSFFTWSNGRRGTNHTQKRLDRAICNQQWIDMCTTISCSTLIRNRSDHFPLLLDF